MSEYRTKPIRVEAVEWKSEYLVPSPSLGLPYWFLGALEVSYGHRLYGKMKIVGENVQVDTGAGTVIAKTGDWIVYWTGSDHHLSVHTFAEFDRTFDLDERRARVRSTTEKPRRP